ncbi:MAG: type II toxin-antitoxin system YafQ family toxin [Candidatus Cloacimonetes bacterium]|nr:type II toxin-antitoxin system YafQ family toxin [Candidatus Cloacimonadota bacterium]MDY0173237.1 type II toxin-antitoxin system YafQ family toxin [Candidatus Cloacimonadaceae bacterium]
MLQVSYTSQFKRDYKKYQNNPSVRAAFMAVVDLLVNKMPLPVRNKDHSLKGDMQDCRECHICPDVLLLYLVHDETLVLIRIGSYANLFN